MLEPILLGLTAVFVGETAWFAYAHVSGFLASTAAGDSSLPFRLIEAVEVLLRKGFSTPAMAGVTMELLLLVVCLSVMFMHEGGLRGQRGRSIYLFLTYAVGLNVALALFMSRRERTRGVSGGSRPPRTIHFGLSALYVILHLTCAVLLSVFAARVAVWKIVLRTLGVVAVLYCVAHRGGSLKTSEQAAENQHNGRTLYGFITGAAIVIFVMTRTKAILAVVSSEESLFSLLGSFVGTCTSSPANTLLFVDLVTTVPLCMLFVLTDTHLNLLERVFFVLGLALCPAVVFPLAMMYATSPAVANRIRMVQGKMQ